MKLIVIFASAAVLLFAGTPQQVTTTTDWLTYSNSTHHFEFKYPKQWQQANTRTDRANIMWVNFVRQSAGVGRNTLYVKIFPDHASFAIEERIIGAHATLTPVTVDGTAQHLYADFSDTPTAFISRDNLYVEIGDPSGEGYLRQIVGTFRFIK
jgi:hypothetical protein